MQPTRRRCLAIAAAGVGGGVAGCLSTGSNVTYPEPQDGSDGGSGGGSDGGSGESEAPEVEPINSRLAEETDRIYDELRWFETEYADTMQEYKGRVREVYNTLQSLRETLDADGRIEADELATVRSLAADVAGSVNDIPEPQFSRHVDFRAVNEDHFPVAERFRGREDWTRVDDELRDLARVYGDASNEVSIDQRYSPNPIDNRLHSWLSADRDTRMFETRHISDDPNAHEDTGQRLPGHGAYVISDSAREIEYLDRPMGGPRFELLSRLTDEFNEFDDSTGRRYRLYIRIHEIETEGEIFPNVTDSIPVFIQRYEDLETAGAAYQSIMSDKVIEDTIQWGTETWNRVLFTDERRNYVHFIRADAFLFAVAPSTTAWEERDDDWAAPLSGTWLNP